MKIHRPALATQTQNQSLLYATHQLATPIGIVANSAHHRGSAMSAINPSTVNNAQKIFFCIE